MAATFAEKALARAAGLDTARAGQILNITPHRVLSHDNTAAIRRIFAQISARVRTPERLAIILDHAVPAPSTLHARNHAEIRAFVQEQHIPHFFEAGVAQPFFDGLEDLVHGALTHRPHDHAGLAVAAASGAAACDFDGEAVVDGVDVGHHQAGRRRRELRHDAFDNGQRCALDKGFNASEHAFFVVVGAVEGRYIDAP